MEFKYADVAKLFRKKCKLFFVANRHKISLKSRSNHYYSPQASSPRIDDEDGSLATFSRPKSDSRKSKVLKKLFSAASRTLQKFLRFVYNQVTHHIS